MQIYPRTLNTSGPLKFQSKRSEPYIHPSAFNSTVELKITKTKPNSVRSQKVSISYMPQTATNKNPVENLLKPKNGNRKSLGNKVPMKAVKKP